MGISKKPLHLLFNRRFITSYLEIRSLTLIGATSLAIASVLSSSSAKEKARAESTLCPSGRFGKLRSMLRIEGVDNIERFDVEFFKVCWYLL